ncbi:MAG: hypothetical protein QM504_07240 [Pseudomonadota bacterium]
MKKIKQMIFWVAVSLIALNLNAAPLATNFTYQGQLKVSNALANGSYDFQFTAYDTDGLLGNTGTNLAQVQVASVSVVNGVFTTQLDFAGVVFQGDKVWLEVAVRTGGSTGGYQQLLPRQEVSSAPYAIQAQFVSADAITGTEIFNGSVGSDDLASNSVTSTKIANNAVNTNQIADNSITASKIANNSVDLSAIQFNAVDSFKIVDNSITAFDLAPNSVGTSEISANAVGISEIAPNAVGSSEIYSNAVGSDEIINSEVQNRITGNCITGLFIQSVNEDGSVNCARPDRFSGVINIPAAAFRDKAGHQNTLLFDWARISNYLYLFATGSTSPTTRGDFEAPVYLPIGAKVNKITAYYYDNDSISDVFILMSLKKRNTIDTNSFFIAQAYLLNSTGASTTIQSISSNSSSNIVATTDYFYSLDLIIEVGKNSDKNSRFYGAKIEYSMVN